MSTAWSVLLNRIDGLSHVWKEWRVNVVTQSEGSASAGAIPMLNSGGVLDQSLLPSSSANGYLMQQNGVALPQRDYLNFQLSFTLVDDPTNNSTDVTLTALDMGTF